MASKIYVKIENVAWIRVTKWLTIGWSLSGSVTARIQQSIHIFSQVRTLPRSSADDCTDPRTIRADDPRIAALAIHVLPHGRQRIAARLPAENLYSMSAEKGKLSVSSTVDALTGMASALLVSSESVSRMLSLLL